MQPRYIIRAGTNKGWVGVGESRQGVGLDDLRRSARRLVNVDFDVLQINRLPIPMDCAYDAFEILVYDIMGQELRVPAYQLLGDSCRDRVQACLYVDASTVEAAVRQAREAQHHGFDSIVLTTHQAHALPQVVRAVHEACGRTMRVLLSSIEPWASHEDLLMIMESLKGMHILAVENPLASKDYHGLARLRQLGHWPVSLEVAISDRTGQRPGAAALDAVRYEACDGFRIDHAMAAFVRLADMAELAGLTCRHGGGADLGILEASYVHAAAAAPSCVWPSNIFGRYVCEHDLLKTPLVFSGKHVEVPQRPGLGIELDVKAMEKYRVGDDAILAE